MENYIVRIYRRSESDTDDLLGIVERTDNGENKRFKSFEELYDIFSPYVKTAEENKLKQIVEQRQYRRFKVKEATLTFNSSTDIGDICDISMGGLSFNSSSIPEDYISSVEISILCGNRKCCAQNILCRNIISHDRSGEPTFQGKSKNKRFSAIFDKLTTTQKLQLRSIIQNHTLEDA